MQNTVKPRVTVTSTRLPVLHTGQNLWGLKFIQVNGPSSRKKNKVISKMKYKHGFLFGMKKFLMFKI